ncbi:MAG TPA: VC0807 family protein [Pseudonocardiaceae bacterium]|nr:VC0807 family protein [Pseudonocardiaceae bacterium]
MNKQLLRSFGPRLLVTIVAPVLVYQLIQSSVDNDVVALAIGAAVPVVWTLGRLASTRKVDPLGVVSTIGFAVGITIAWLSGGNPLALELRDAVPTGLIGLACVISVLVGRPLYLLMLRFLAKRRPDAGPVPVRSATVITEVIGITLVVHAVVLVVFALNVSVSTYVGTSQLIGWLIIGAGVAVIAWYRRRTRSLGPAEMSTAAVNE